MADQKLDNLLNLALDSTEEERKKSGNLNIGYEERSGNWDIIVKYSGDAEALSGERIRYSVTVICSGESFGRRDTGVCIKTADRVYRASKTVVFSGKSGAGCRLHPSGSGGVFSGSFAGRKYSRRCLNR